MTSLETYRSFLAVYRAGSISEAARQRGLSQPAVSQAIANLENTTGAALFERSKSGMRPTPRGEALYSRLVEPLERLEQLEQSFSEPVTLPLRLGTSPEAFHEYVLPRIARHQLQLEVEFSPDRSLFRALQVGDLDAVLAPQNPSLRGLIAEPVTEIRYLLISFQRLSEPERQSAVQLNAHPWVTYSEARPLTRRFFSQHLGGRFEAQTQLVVPDLRAVVRAVELGLGIGIVPDFAARRSMGEGRLFGYELAIPNSQWFLAIRESDQERPQIRTILQCLK